MKFLTVLEVSTLYGIERSSIVGLINAGRLPARRGPSRRKEWLIRERDWLSYEKNKTKRGRPRKSGMVVRTGLVPGFACPYPDCSSVLPSRHGLRIHLGTDHEGLDYEGSRRCSRCSIIFDDDNPRAPGGTICTPCAGEVQCGHFVIAVARPEAHPSNGLWAGRPDSETLRQQRWDRYNEKRRRRT